MQNKEIKWKEIAYNAYRLAKLLQALIGFLLGRFCFGSSPPFRNSTIFGAARLTPPARRYFSSSCCLEHYLVRDSHLGAAERFFVRLNSPATAVDIFRSPADWNAILCERAVPKRLNERGNCPKTFSNCSCVLEDISR
jgi:hypothetical protein